MRKVCLLIVSVLALQRLVATPPQGTSPDTDLPARIKLFEAENAVIKNELVRHRQELADLGATAGVQRAMRLTELKVVGGPFAPGDPVRIRYRVKNQEKHELRLPLEGTLTVGVRQHWLERLGRDAEIPTMPAQIARDGRRYAAGGATIRLTGSIPAGHELPFEQIVQTHGFPSGSYRYHVTLQDMNHKVIELAAVEFELIEKRAP